MKFQSSIMARPQASLWLALRLPSLPAMALGVVNLDASYPAAVVEKQGVIYANKAARAAGVVRGMDVTTATLLSNCEIQQRDHAAESALMDQLSEHLYQFTPYIESYRCEPISQGGLLLELSSCLCLFENLQKLSAQIFAFMQDNLYEYVHGLAHTPQGAWLLSFASYEIKGNEDKPLFIERLKQLPITLLHDYPAAVDGLHKMGFVVLADLVRQIEAKSLGSITKRFGHEFTDALSAIFALDHQFQQASLFQKPPELYKPVEYFAETLQFDYPLRQLDQLHRPVEILLQQLSDYLRKRQQQTQLIEWTLADIYHNRAPLLVRSDNPQTHWQLLFDLTLIQLEQHQLPFEVDTLELRCINTSPLQSANDVLDFNQTRKSDRRTRDFAITAAKLKARLGDAALYKLSYHDSYLPEMSNCPISLAEIPNQHLPPAHTKGLRPTWLLLEPVEMERRGENLYWRGQVELLVGPERIQNNWWNKPVARDYFLAQRSDHLRLWVYRDLHSQQWYVQGIFG
jgi:protein ImuB